jgi:hypothetical protein
MQATAARAAARLIAALCSVGLAAVRNRTSISDLLRSVIDAGIGTHRVKPRVLPVRSVQLIATRPIVDDDQPSAYKRMGRVRG